ncbi:hypothetical protein ACUNER_17700 [Serratia sp. IR-2025]
MLTTVYFDKPPNQYAWIDLTLAVTEVLWLLPATARPADIEQAGHLFNATGLEVAGLQFSLLSASILPAQQTCWIEFRTGVSGTSTCWPRPVIPIANGQNPPIGLIT